MNLVKNNKSSYYQIIYFINCKRTTHSTKKTIRSEAVQYLEEFSKKLVNISFAKKTKRQKTITKYVLTLSEFKKEYLEYSKPVKSKSYIISIDYAFKYFIEYAGDIPLDQIQTRTVDKFIYSTFSRTQRGAHQYYRTLKAVINKAVEWNFISVNPFTKVRFPRLSKTFPVFIPEDEFIIILANTQYQHLRDIFTIAFYTGLRIGELVNM